MLGPREIQPRHESVVATVRAADDDPPDVSPEQVARQPDATRRLGRSHERTDHTDRHRFWMHRVLTCRNGHGLTVGDGTDLGAT